MANTKDTYISLYTLTYIMQHLEHNKLMSSEHLATMLYIDLQTAFEDGKITAQSIRDYYALMEDNENSDHWCEVRNNNEVIDKLITCVMIAYKNVIQHDLPPAAGVVKH